MKKNKGFDFNKSVLKKTMLFYQLDFVTPGNTPLCAISRNRCRDKPN